MPAQHDHDQDHDRDREHEHVGGGDGELGDVEDAAEAAHGGAHGEGEELVVDVADAHRPRRQLVLADRHPGAPHPRLLEAHRDEDGRRHQPEPEEVVRVAARIRSRSRRASASGCRRAPGRRWSARPSCARPRARSRRSRGSRWPGSRRGAGASGRRRGSRRPRRRSPSTASIGQKEKWSWTMSGWPAHLDPAHLAEPGQRRPEVRPLGLELPGRDDPVAVGPDREERRVAEVEEARRTPRRC